MSNVSSQLAFLKNAARYPKVEVTPTTVPTVQMSADEWNKMIEVAVAHEKRFDEWNIIFSSDLVVDVDETMLANANSCIKALYFAATPAPGHRYALTYLYHWGDSDFRVSIVDYDESDGTETEVVTNYQFTGDTLSDLEDSNGNVIGKIYASISGYNAVVAQGGATTNRMPYCNDVCWRYNQDIIIAERFKAVTTEATAATLAVSALEETVSPTLLGCANTVPTDALKCAAANAEVKALYLNVQPASGHRYVLSYLYLQTSDNSWYMSLVDLDVSAGTATLLVNSCQLTDKTVSPIVDVNGNEIGYIYVDSDNYTLIANQGEGYARMPYLLSPSFSKSSQTILMEAELTNTTVISQNAATRVAEVEEQLSPTLLGCANTVPTDALKCAAANAEVKALYLNVQPASGHRYVLSYLYLQTSDNSWYMSLADLDVSAGTATLLVNSCQLTDKTMSPIVDVNGNEIGYIYVDSDNYTLIANQGEGYARMPYLLSPCYDAMTQTNIYRTLTSQRIGSLEEKASKKQITLWGDSITWGSASTTNSGCYAALLQTMLSNAGYNHRVINCGVGGDNMPTILGRMGGTMLYLTRDLTIPASASSSVEVDRVVNYTQVGRYLKASCKTDAQIQLMLQGDLGRSHIDDTDNAKMHTVNPVLINGVECVWTWNPAVEGRADEGSYTLAVKEDQSAAITLKAGSPIYPHGARLKSDVAVFAMGTNSGWDDVDEYMSMIDKAIDAVDTKQYIVCSPYGGTALVEQGVSGLQTLEAALQVKYGAKYFNWRKYLVEEGLSVEGLTATSADNMAIAAGEVPPSLLADEVHPNDYGHDAIAKRLYQMMVALSYFD